MQELRVAADGLGMEQKPESLWWTSRCAQVCNIDMNIVAAIENIYLSVQKERFVILGHAFERSGKGIQSLDDRLPRGTKAWFKEAHINKCKTLSQKQKWSRLMNHINMQCCVFAL